MILVLQLWFSSKKTQSFLPQQPLKQPLKMKVAKNEGRKAKNKGKKAKNKGKNFALV